MVSTSNYLGSGQNGLSGVLTVDHRHESTLGLKRPPVIRLPLQFTRLNTGILQQQLILLH